MNEKDFMLRNQINTIIEKLELFISAYGHDYNANSASKSELAEMLNGTLKILDYLKKYIESEEYIKTLYIDVIKRIYIFIREYESGRFEGRKSDGSPRNLLPDFRYSRRELVVGMRMISRMFNRKATDILRTLLVYIERDNLPIQELTWEYQALVNFIIGIVHKDQHRVEYLIMKLDEILIECSLCEDIPNIGEPIEGEECSTTINTSSMKDCFLDGVFDDQEEDEERKRIRDKLAVLDELVDDLEGKKDD